MRAIHPTSPLLLTTAIFAAVLSHSQAGHAQGYISGIEWQEPPVVDPGATNDSPPSDATILFGGEDASAWTNAENWHVNDGNLVSGKGPVTTKESFGDCQLHIEWSAPTPPKGNSQGRGNSGVFLMGKYEVQVLDSYDNPTYFDGQAGSIYKQTPPLVNAMRPPGEWNTYDIFWTAPRFEEDGSLKSPAYVTLVHNGVLALNHFELLGDTPYDRPPRYDAHPPRGPISLQDHGNPVRFRNIWIREIKPLESKRVSEPYVQQGDTKTPVAK